VLLGDHVGSVGVTLVLVHVVVGPELDGPPLLQLVAALVTFGKFPRFPSGGTCKSRDLSDIIVRTQS
jgi:hypothetical protein